MLDLVDLFTTNLPILINNTKLSLSVFQRHSYDNRNTTHQKRNPMDFREVEQRFKNYKL
jgi:hypothetical protein